MIKPGNTYSRRLVLAAGMMAGAAAASTLKGTHAPEPAAPIDLTSDAGRFRIYMLMRGALDDRLVIGFLSGRYYGVIDDEITPLYGFVSATFARYRLRSDGGYDGASYEVPFFTDLETGVALEHWRNPYTSETVEVPKLGFPPAVLLFKPDLTITLPQAPPGLIMRNRISATQSAGPDVWFTEETVSSMQSAGTPKALRYNELVTMHGARADLSQSNAKRVPCETSYTSVVSFRPWLKMGDRAGHLMGVGAGRYGAALDDLPEQWRVAAAAHRPEVLKDPSHGLLELLAQ